MKTQLTPRDTQQLSAYLDGALSSAERADLEKRLATRADLAAGLEELRQTRAVLRAAPRRKAPRNFTLKPDMVPARRTAWRGWTPVFSFASAATALVALVMLLGQMLPLGGAAAPMAMPVAMEKQAAPQAQDTVQATPMIITWGQTQGYGMGGGGGNDMAAASAPGGLAAEPPAAPESIRAMPTATPEGNPPAATEQPPLMLAAPTEMPAAADANGLILGIAPTEEQGSISTPQTVQETAPARQSQPGIPQPWLTIGLFVAAAGFAAGAILLRRR